MPTEGTSVREHVLYRLSRPATPEQEVQRLQDIYGSLETGMPAILKVLQEQFSVLHTRTQMLLTLSTITLTITGFSGSKINEAGWGAQFCMSVGLGFVVVALTLILIVSLRVRWVTQFCAQNNQDQILQIVRYRNWRTVMYLIELTLLLVGLALYSTSLMLYVTH